MRFLTTLLLGTALAVPAMAQTTTHPHKARPHAMRAPMEQSTSPNAEVNKAYMGGGAILEGAPGGPAPPPSAVLSMPPNSPLPPPQR